MQHVPIGGWGQGLVDVQVFPSVQVLLAPVQAACEPWAQTPVTELQHAPWGGRGQMLGEQLPFMVQTLETEQLAWLVMVQHPEKEQQEPCGGRQGLGGPQVRPAVQTFGAAQ